MDLDHILNELGEDRSLNRGAVVPPIMQTSNFCFPNVAAMRAALESELDNAFYTRGNNPTVEILRRKVAALEGTDDALVFASGSAAITAAVISCVKAGDHVVCVEKPYSWTNKLLTLLLAKFGVECTMIDGTKVENWQAAIQPNTTLFMLESPNSFTFELQDLPAVAAIAKAHNIATICDNSYATPLYQRPHEMGVDIVVHSASKYLSGHSDVVAGVLCSTKARIESIFQSEFMTLGGIISPNDAWLILRGLRTLGVRMERVSATAAQVVAFLEKHPKVERVYYPHSPSHPQFELAKKQQKKGCGQFSITLKAPDMDSADRFVDSLKRFLMACSWGGFESLVFPVSALYASPNYGKSSLPWNMIRVYVGLEDPEILIADLAQALDQV